MNQFWFPRLSPDRQRVASGDKQLWLRAGGVDRMLAPDGTAPVWLDAQTILYRRASDGWLMLAREADGWRPTILREKGYNTITAAGGRWVAGRAERGNEHIDWSDGTTTRGAPQPAIGPQGDKAWLDTGGRLWINGTLIDDRACTEPRWAGTWLVYRVADREVYALEPGRSEPFGPYNIEPQEFWPILTFAPNGDPWLITHGHTRLMVRRPSTSTGYVIEGETHFPDAGFIDASHLRVVCSTGRGEPRDITIDITAPRVDLRVATPKPPDPPRPPDPPTPPDPPKPPEPSMRVPNEVLALLSAYVSRFPFPTGAPGAAKDDRARQWSTRFAEQVNYSRPGEGWGMKKADPGRPVSKDTLARKIGDRLYFVDLLTGVGTDDTHLSGATEMEEITGQVFVPVTPTNHLGTAPPVDPPVDPPQPPVTPPSTVDLGPVLARLDALTAAVATLARGERQEQLAQSVLQKIGEDGAATRTAIANKRFTIF